jgi:Prolyl oligopeptidase family
MHRFRSTYQLMLFAFAIALLLGNGMATPARAGAWSTNDLKTTAPLPSGTVTINQVTVTWQVGNYWSDGLRIFGLVCTPTSLSGPRPIAILNHGLVAVPVGSAVLFPAIEQNGWTGCTKLASKGWLAAISTYRGEIIGSAIGGGLPAPFTTYWAQSDGGLELCLGEVDDVLNLLSAVTALPNVNASHVLMWGHSHGSCITERAIERGAPVQIAVSLDGPTDFTTWTNNNLLLAPTVVAQDARSTAWPGNNPAALENVKFLRIHAEGDKIVTPDQGCELASRLPGIANYYLYSAISPPGVYWAASKKCAAFPMPWRKGQLLPDEYAGGVWASPTFLMYSGLSHTAILNKAWPEWRSFVNAVTKADHWGATIPAQFFILEN